MNILRWIGGIVVGHLSRTLFVWGTGWLAFGALGVDAAFRPHAWSPSFRWLVISAALQSWQLRSQRTWDYPRMKSSRSIWQGSFTTSARYGCLLRF